MVWNGWDILFRYGMYSSESSEWQWMKRWVNQALSSRRSVALVLQRNKLLEMPKKVASDITSGWAEKCTHNCTKFDSSCTKYLQKSPLGELCTAPSFPSTKYAKKLVLTICAEKVTTNCCKKKKLSIRRANNGTILYRSHRCWKPQQFFRPGGYVYKRRARFVHLTSIMHDYLCRYTIETIEPEAWTDGVLLRRSEQGQKVSSILVSRVFRKCTIESFGTCT